MLVRGGLVVDGTGAAPRRADVAISRGRVTLLDAGQAASADQTLDAVGCFVAPGFIDIHGHSDLTCLVGPDAASRVAAGVTTECIGNCGYGAFPMAGEVLRRRQGEFPPSVLRIDWSDVQGYFARAHSIGSAINRVVLAAHGNVRGCVMGYGDRRASRRQIHTMCQIVDQCMAAGCAGFSSGLTYAPGMWADTREMIALVGVVASHDGLYASHIRDEGDTVLQATEEFIEVLRQTGCRGQLSHVKVAEPRNWCHLPALGRLLNAARAEGIDLHVDRYPYTASATDLATIVLPRSAVIGDADEVLTRLADRGLRQEILRRIRDQKGPDLARWLENVVVASVKNQALAPCVGKNLSQLPDVLGLADPLEAAVKLIHDDRFATQGIHFSMSSENLREIYSWDFVAVGSDSSCRDSFDATNGQRPHPRAYGTPARFLDLVVRKWGLMDWGQAVRRMTSLPARQLGLADRGVLRDGAWADLAVFDPGTFTDEATYQTPCRPPAGLVATLVNGRIAWRNGAHAHTRSGSILKTGPRPCNGKI